MVSAGKIHLGKASAEESQSLLSGSRCKSIPRPTPNRRGQSPGKVFGDHALPCPVESSAAGNTQRCSVGSHRERRSLQADALQCQLDDSRTRCKGSPQWRRRTKYSCVYFKNTVVLAGQYAELNNTNCVLSYIPAVDPACKAIATGDKIWAIALFWRARLGESIKRSGQFRL